MSNKVSQPWFLLGNGKLISQKRKGKKEEGKLGFSIFLFSFLFFLFKQSFSLFSLYGENEFI